MKKKNFVVPAIWLIAIAAGYGAYKWISYQIDIYYSNLAAEQFGNDSAYGQLKFQPKIPKPSPGRAAIAIWAGCAPAARMRPSYDQAIASRVRAFPQ